MLIALCALLTVQQTTPKDLPELVKLINSGYQKLHGFRDTWEMKGDDGTSMTIKRTIDGTRYHEILHTSDTDVMETGCDDSTSYAIFYPNHVYSQSKIDPNAKPTPPAKAEKGSIQFNIETQGFTILSDPPAKIVSVTTEVIDGQKVRHFVAKATNPANGNKFKADLLLLATDWVLTDFTVTVSKKGEPDQVSHFSAKVETGLSIADDEFRLDSAKVQDFKQVTPEEYQKAAAGGSGIAPAKNSSKSVS
jgi:hypothetical protein